MLVCLPLISGLLVWGWFWLASEDIEGRCRLAWLKSAVVHGLVLVLLTEGLSLHHQLNQAACIRFWAIVIPIEVVALWLRKRHSRYSREWKGYLTHSAFRSLMPLGAVGEWCAILILVILGITLVTALVSAPNNWDAMVYHLPRVMHWLQHQSISHYPSHVTRQLSLVGGAGYWVAHLQILGGSDRYAHLVQWLGFLGCLCSTSLLAHNLSGRKAEWLAAFLCCTLPMAIMQASTAQTDLIASFWLSTLAYFILAVDRPQGSLFGLSLNRAQCFNQLFHDLHEHPFHRQWFWVTATLALALITKPTNWVFVLPLLAILWLRWWEQARDAGFPGIGGALRAFGLTATVGIASFSVLIPSLWRNYDTFGHIFGSLGERTANPVLGLRPTLSHALKTLALNLPIPGIWSAIDHLHTHWLHLSLADPRFNLGLPPPYDPNTSSWEAFFKVIAPHEDFVGYPAYILLLGWAMLALGPLRPRRSPQPDLRVYLLILALLANLLGFWLLFKWQPWENRLLLPLAVLGVPIIATYLCQWVDQPWHRLLVGILGLVAISYALTPIRHPLIALPSGAQEQSPSILTLSREALYFSGARKELYGPYQQVAALIHEHQCQRVGLVLVGESWEYPLWVLLQHQAPVKIRHIAVENASAVLPPPFADQELCAIISFRSGYQPPPMGQNLPWKRQPIATTPYLDLFYRSVQKSGS